MCRAKLSAAVVLSFVIAVAVAGVPAAQGTDSLVVTRAAICVNIEEREPVGADTTFSKDVGALYCFTQIEGAKDSTAVEHVWYYKGEEVTRVALAVKAARWRTWSSKKIMETWTGPWSVEVLSAEGDILKKLNFKVK